MQECSYPTWVSHQFLPFGDDCVGEAGWSKHSPGNKQRHTQQRLSALVHLFVLLIHLVWWSHLMFSAETRFGELT